MSKGIIAIDYGTKYCGIAYTENAVNIFPVKVAGHNEIEAVIIDLMNDKSIHLIVLGLPRSTDGSENELCAKARQLGRRLKRQFDLPIDYVDERFSSKQSVTKDKKQRIDDMAAAQILEYYLAQR